MSATLVIVSVLPLNEAVSDRKCNIWKGGFVKKTQTSPCPLKSAAKICININGFAFFRLLRPTKDLGEQALQRGSLLFF